MTRRSLLGAIAGALAIESNLKASPKTATEVLPVLSADSHLPEKSWRDLLAPKLREIARREGKTFVEPPEHFGTLVQLGLYGSIEIQYQKLVRAS